MHHFFNEKAVHVDKRMIVKIDGSLLKSITIPCMKPLDLNKKIFPSRIICKKMHHYNPTLGGTCREKLKMHHFFYLQCSTSKCTILLILGAKCRENGRKCTIFCFVSVRRMAKEYNLHQKSAPVLLFKAISAPQGKY